MPANSNGKVSIEVGVDASKIGSQVNAEAKASGAKVASEIEQGINKGAADGSKSIPNKTKDPIDQSSEEARKSFNDAFDGLGGEIASSFAAGFAAFAIGDVIGDAFSGASEAQQGIADLNASLGLTTTESKKADNAARNLFEDAYAGSIGEAQSAVEQVLGSITGLRDKGGKAIQDAAENAQTLASVMGIDVADGAQTAGAMINTGMAANAQEAFDIIGGGLQKVTPALRGEAVDALNEYGTYFTQLGISGAGAMAAIGDASQISQYALDKTGDAIKELTVRATDGTAADAFKALGLNAEDMATAIASGGPEAEKAFSQIIAGLQGIENPAEQSQKAIALFGTPLEDIGTDKVPQFLDAMSSAANGTDQFVGKMDEIDQEANDTFGVQWKSLMNTFTSAAQSALAPVVELMQNLVTWMVENKDVILPLGVAIGTLVSAWTAYQVALNAAKIAQLAFNAVAAANPLGIIITLIAAVVAALVYFFTQTETGRKAWETFTTWLVTAWNWIKDTAVAVWNAVAEFFTGLWEGITTGVTNAWNAIKDFFITVFNAIKSVVTVVWDAIKIYFVTMFTIYKTIFTVAFNAIKTVVTTVFNAIKTFISNVWNGIKTVTSTVWNGIKTGVSTAINAVKTTIANVLNSIKSTWSNIWNSVKSKVSDIWEGIKSGISNGVNAAYNKVKDIKSKITGFFSGAGTWLVDSGKKILNGLRDGIKSAVSGVTSAISGAMDKVRSFLPFSPAKEGPFSGRGWTPYSGAAIMDGFAEGINSNVGVAQAAIRDAMSGVQVGVSPISGGTAAIAQGVTSSNRTSSTSTTTTSTAQVNVQVMMDDLAQLRDLEDFMNMLRVRARMNGVNGVRM